MNDSLTHWLALREPFDAAARSGALTRGIAAALPRDRPLSILDLGSGTGANVRYLARHLPADQRWLLVDSDPAVLADLPSRMPPAALAHVEVRQLDLGARDAPEIFDRRDLVTASALLDLVSESFLLWLAERCRSSGAAALFALTYTGRARCAPAEPEDGEMCELLNRHQQQCDKGFGPAAGPDAMACAERAFVAAGYRVQRAPSDWQITSDAGELQRLLFQGWVDAAVYVAPAQSAMAADWFARRLGHIATGRSRVMVSHEDFAAFPIR